VPTARRMCRPRGRGFTLIELLVVISIIALLVAILMPGLARAKDLARQATCLTRVKNQMSAVHMYAGEERGWIPVGPSTPMALGGGMMGPPYSQVASNQVWIGSLVAYNGMGALLYRKNLGQAEAFFCPDDDSADPKEELPKIVNRTGQDAYGSYLFRQLDGRDTASAGKGRLEDLGNNGVGSRVSALSLDMNSLLQIPGVPVRTNHRTLRVNIGFAAGHARTYDNLADRFTLRHGDEMSMFNRLEEILQNADGVGD
jgi:prepilin-type N-terminal cleavage/methylation domain-containing protein